MKLYIENYKNIRNITIPIHNNKAILLGANGVGKTNTLEAVYYGNARLIDTDTRFARTYFLTFDVLPDQHYPNETMITEMFHVKKSNVLETLTAFLEDAYTSFRRPLIRKLVKDALDTLSYALKNKKFDPSPMAITRLVLLNKIYENAVRNNEKYIIMVDSPELFAHPLLMDEITHILTELHSLGCLVIVSTHSDQVISRMFTSFEELIKIEKKDDGFITVTVADMQAVIRDIKAFYAREEYLVHNFSKPETIDGGLVKLIEDDIEGYLITALRDHIITVYFSNIIILGEGASEDVLFDYIDNVLHPVWVSEHKIRFLSCQGKASFPLYFCLLNHLNVKVITLYDMDRLSNPVHEAFHVAFHRYHEEHPYLFRYNYIDPDLEHYLDYTEGKKIQSIIKPVNIYNYTFLNHDNNENLKKLMSVIYSHVKKLDREEPQNEH